MINLKNNAMNEKGKWNLCSATFVKNFNLKRHLREVHSLQKSEIKEIERVRQSAGEFSCTSCTKTFNRIGNLIEHVRLSHGNKSNREECSR